jgi:hypothetical protein
LKAIPTAFNGVMYRSKSEARLAVCFDAWGWDFEYEPKIRSMPGFTPDFKITQKNGAIRIIEYKPVFPVDRYLRKLKSNFVTLLNNNRHSTIKIRCELWCIDFFNSVEQCFYLDNDGRFVRFEITKEKSFSHGYEFRFDLAESSPARVDLTGIMSQENK